MLNQVEIGSVKIEPGLFRERMKVNRSYLMELETSCLLQNFYAEAGLGLNGSQAIFDPANEKIHWGWESPTCQLRGHFLGHWLSAASKLVAYDGDAELKTKIDFIVSELSRCQKLNGGEWVGSIPEKYFDILAEERYIWSPQYTMHKTIMGLFHAYKYTNNRTALSVIDHMANWYAKWIRAVQKKNPAAVYSGEEAGMLEIWAECYEETGREKFLTLAESYADQGTFKGLLDGHDALSNCHANATIPLSHGSAKMYEITGDAKWKKLTELFWKCAVTDRGYYVTTGMNAGEFWIPPFRQGEFIGDRDQEFCTVYNMVRTANYLYKWTGKTEYADYIEQALYNGFLTQQNAFTAMPTYFLPLHAGSKKKWGSKRNDFWCCHGTMIQAQTIYPELIYFSDEEKNEILISQFIPSKYEFKKDDAKISISQNTDMKFYGAQTLFDNDTNNSAFSRWSLKFEVKAELPKTQEEDDEKPAKKGKVKFTLKIRIPSWFTGEPLVEENGKKITPVIKNNYIVLKREWSDDKINVFFPSTLRTVPLPDMPEIAAFMDGPIVLAGLTDADCGLKGDFEKPETFITPLSEHTYTTFPWKQNNYRTRDQEKNFVLKPLYEITDEEYTIYFTKKWGEFARLSGK